MRVLISSIEAMYGLEIVRESKGQVKRGSVYVLLDRMEQKRFVTHEPEANPPSDRSGMRRMVYRPTGLGERTLKAMEAATEASNAEFAGLTV